MLLLDLSTYAQELIVEYGYWGPFVLLILCGCGLPLPEEVSLIGAGILIHDGADYTTMLLVCLAGVLCGDAIPYTVGRVFGKDALRLRFVRRLIHPRRFRGLERRFEEHSMWGIFSCRFFPGLRWPGYFLAGTMRMSVGRWFLLDLAGALIQVPIALYLGRLFGANVERLQNELGVFQMVAGGVLIVAVGTYIFRRRLRKGAARRASRRARGPVGGPQESDSGPGPGPLVGPEHREAGPQAVVTEPGSRTRVAARGPDALGGEARIAER